VRTAKSFWFRKFFMHVKNPAGFLKMVNLFSKSRTSKRRIPMGKMLVVLLVSLLSLHAEAKMVSKNVTYSDNGQTFIGYLAYDDAVKGKRPGVLVAHEWWGLNDFTREKARQMAALGYVAFAPDMYGNGQTTVDPRIAAKMAGEVRGTKLLRDRVVAGFNELLRQDNVDTGRIVAMGFCFGGTAVLKLAFSGAPVRGVVTFHASIIVPTPEEAGLIRTKLLVLHGADDPYAPRDTIARFQESLRAAKVDWQMVYYGNAVHGFTNPSNGTDNAKGLAYNPLAAERAWTSMRLFFDEVLRPGNKSGVR
jgi:dienelactone hydrolase